MSKADELITQAVLKVQEAQAKRKEAASGAPGSNETLIKKQNFSAEKVINAVNNAGSLDEKLKAYERASGYNQKSDSGEE